MDYDDIAELYYITHIDNIPSIIVDGILSHKRASKQQHKPLRLKRSRAVVPARVYRVVDLSMNT